MINLDYSKLKHFLLLSLFVFISGLSKSQETDYLNTVIERINGLETELKNIQNKNNTKNVSNNDWYTNAVASHEQRLSNLEEEIRVLNGNLEQLSFELKGIKELIQKKDTSQSLKSSVTEESFSNINQQTNPEIINKKTEIIEDPNIKKNPSMKVLGTINENDSKKNISDAPNNNLNLKEEGISNEQLSLLQKNPSEIYSYAYDMLLRENFTEAEKSFKAFIGEHPNDPLASNAYYWLGETYYVQKKFQLAAISFARGFQSFPKGNKALDQLFKLALTFMNLGKNEDACAAFSKLESEFPSAPKRISNRAKDYIKRAKC
jgi:tol-pal system protein YbgF